MFTSPGSKPSCGHSAAKKVLRCTKVTPPAGWIATVGFANGVWDHASLIISIVNCWLSAGMSSV